MKKMKSKEEKFNLSNKIEKYEKVMEWNCVDSVLDVRDVKEFIKRTLEDLENMNLNRKDILHKFENRAGDDLKWKKN